MLVSSTRWCGGRANLRTILASKFLKAKLDRASSAEPSSFDLVFYVKDTKYWYQLELDERQVHLEKLSYYKTSQPIMLFERTLKDGQSVVQINQNAEKISAAALFDAQNNQSVLPIDEIETSLHPKLLEKILFEYLKTPSRSQIIVTTHNDGLLDLVDDLIRKDSVWFTEKKKSGITDLYKLTDFRGLNRLSSIREAYRNKRFGATMG